MKKMLRLILIVAVAMLPMFPSVGLKSVSIPSYNLTAKGECGYVMLSWDKIPFAQSYWIYRGPGENQEYSTPLTDFPLKTNEFKDDINIENGNKYCYYVTGVNENAEEIGKTIEACAIPKCQDEEKPPEESQDCNLVLKFTIGKEMYERNAVKKGPMTAKPEMKSNRMFLVVKYVADEVGATTAWDAATKTVTIKTLDGNTILLKIGNPNATVNGKIIPIDPNNPKVVPYISNGRTLCPLRLTGENLGATGPDKIKWFQDTQTAELIFTDPSCECTWTRCFIKEIKQIVTVGNIMPKYKFKLVVEGCDFKPHIYWVVSDIADITGKYYISKYPYCVSLCVMPRTGQVVKWRTEIGSASNCCTGVTNQEAEGYEKPSLHLFATKKMCQGVNSVINAEDAFGNNYTIETNTNYCNECEEGKWFLVKGDFIKGRKNVIKADSIKHLVDFDFLPLAFKTVCLEILATSDHEESFSFYGQDSEGVIWWVGGNLEGAQADMKQVKEGECWRLMLNNIMLSNPSESIEGQKYEVFNGIVGATKVNCPCASNETKAQNAKVMVKITKLNCSDRKPFALGVDEKKREWKLFFSKGACTSLKLNEWHEVDGDLVRDKQGTPTLRVVDVKLIPDLGLKEKPDFCVCIKLEWIYSSGLYYYISGKGPGIDWCSIFIFNDTESLNKIKDFKIGDCVKICGKGYQYIYEGKVGYYIDEIMSTTKSDCECKDINARCQNVTVVENNCRTKPPTVEVKNKEGKQFNLLLPIKTNCSDFAKGTCWTVCGKFINDKVFSVALHEEIVCNPLNCCWEFSFTYGMSPPHCPDEVFTETWKMKSLCKDGQNFVQLSSGDGISFYPSSFVLSAGEEKSFTLTTTMPPKKGDQTFKDLWFQVKLNCKGVGDQNRAVRVYYKKDCP
jgi:uncharacterized protein YuzB (UPF0349 family)